MDKIKENYDRVLLIVIGLITLIAGSMLIMKSFAIGQKFPGVDTGDGSKFEESQVDKVEKANTLVDTPMEWKAPMAQGDNKVYRLMASIPIVWKEGVDEPIDLFNEDTPVREGISNKYLMDHNLPYRRDDVLNLDLDGDNFTNLEEFENGATNPRDPNDFPDATLKLQVADITTEPYIVMFASQAGGEDFSVRRMAPAGVRLTREQRWPTTWAKLNETFPASGADIDRFKATDFVEKDVTIETTGETLKNVGVLTVEDSVSGKKIELVQRQKTDIPIYRATFRYNGPGGADDFGGKEFEPGDTFKLNGTDIEVKVVGITENEVELESTEGGQNPKTFKRSR